MTYQTNYLALSWSVSRGRDTEGYNICRLDDRATDKRYKCMGGGYDMVGTVVGDYLQEAFQKELLSIADQSAATCSKADGYKSNDKALYGVCWHKDDNRVSINGACGLESVKRIAEAVGVSITDNYNKRKQATEGFFVSWQA